jgi:dipeptidyl aminopeptidase/acylaminoacyl peptidase
MPKQKTLTPDDVLKLPVLSGDPQISPAGDTIAFVRGELVRDGTRQTKQNIWLADGNGKNVRQFTSGPRADFHPRWSPDGTKLAFFSDRLEDGKLQIFVMNRDGGEARAITENKGRFDTSSNRGALQWSPDGKQIYFLMPDPETDEEKKKKETKDDAIEYEKNPKFSRLWSIDVNSRKLTQLTRGDLQVWEAHLSPNGRDFAMIVSDHPADGSWYHGRLTRMSSRGGAVKTLYTPQKRQIAFPRWSPDGKQIAFMSSVWSDRGVFQGSVFVIGSNGGVARDVTGDYPGSFGCMEWIRGGRTLLACGHEKGEAAFAELDPHTAHVSTLWREPIGLSEHYWPRFTLSKNRSTLAIVREGPREPRDVWSVELRGLSNTKTRGALKWTRVTHEHSRAREFSLGDQEIVSWQSRDGTEIRGVLIKPVGYKRGRRYPTIVCPHGGPTSLVANGFLISNLWSQTLANHGYAVFFPNFRGSTGFGLKFAEANVGDMGGMDFHDIDSGVDALIERGITDGRRLGLGGWSYGGFMSCWTVTQTDRYKCAVMGAGISNWQSFHGNTEIPTWDVCHYDADPYQRDGVHSKFSGMNYISRVKTPTLILHGENDRCVPIEQAYQFYRALRDHGVESELVVYPRAGHGISEKVHWLDLRKRVAAWYDKHVKRS